MPTRFRTLLLLVAFAVTPAARAADPPKAEVPPKKNFKVDGHTAFVSMPSKLDEKKPIPWVWYAPTFPGLPEARENWMFERFLAAGIAIAGVDVGESYGSPKGRATYTALYKELVTNRNFAPKPVLLARSRGGLMLYNWAAENADKVAGIAGIYPVCNLRSFPGLEKACGAYGLTRAELEEQLDKHNPVARLAPLAKAGVPIFHIHGDVDKVVPLKDNSGEVAKQYEKLGGKMELKVAKGQGHNLWEGFFQCQELVDFVLARSIPAKEPNKAPAPDKR
jgi:pimeloyl-ACP methyl ester carboxylesterase